jgi:hypothetical protein
MVDMSTLAGTTCPNKYSLYKRHGPRRPKARLRLLIRPIQSPAARRKRPEMDRFSHALKNLHQPLRH